FPRFFGRYDPASQTQHGRLEREPSARRGLVEERRHDAVTALVISPARGDLFHPVGEAKQVVEGRGVELLGSQNVVERRRWPQSLSHAEGRAASSGKPPG